MPRRDFLKTSLALLGLVSAAPHLFAQTAAGAPGTRRLFFTAERVARLRERVQHNARWQARWKTLLKSAEELSTRGLAPDGQGTAANFESLSRRISTIAFVLGLAWRITGERRYAESLRYALKQGLTVTPWNRPRMQNRRPPWHGDLSTAAIVIGYAAGREALEDFLSPEERQQFSAGMLRLGVEPLLRDWVLPETRIHALDSMGHNWWTVCIAGAGIGVLALIDEEPRARDWLRQIDASLDEFFDYQGHVLHNKPANFDPAGAFYESVGYAEYALFEYLIYRLARLNVVPSPPATIPVLDRAGEFFIHALYPASTGSVSVNFGDSSPRAGGDRTLRLLGSLGRGRELAAWYLQRRESDYVDPLALLYYDEEDVTARNDLPLSVAYYGIGWAMLRTSWEEDATLLAVRSGDSWNHAHADAGSFVLYHAGHPLLIDSGTCSYARKEYIGYYVTSRAHNVVLFNGEGQPKEDVHERGAKFPGKLHDLIDGLGLKYIYADATGPMSPHFKRNYRHWLWLDGVILVFDDILAHEEGRFDWLLHYAGEARREGASVEIANGPAHARVVMLHPAHPAVRDESGLVEYRPDETRTYLAFSPSAPARAQKFIVAIFPESAGVTAPTVELLQEPGMAGSAGVLGVRVKSATEVTEVYLNLEADGRRMHLNSNQVIAGWETDAYMVGFTRPMESAAADAASVSRYFMVFGSYLRRNGRSALDAFSKVTAVWQPGSNVEMLAHTQPNVEVALANPAVPESLKVNGAARAFRHGDGMIRFRADE